MQIGLLEPATLIYSKLRLCFIFRREKRSPILNPFFDSAWNDDTPKYSKRGIRETGNLHVGLRLFFFFAKGAPKPLTSLTLNVYFFFSLSWWKLYFFTVQLWVVVRSRWRCSRPPHPWTWSHQVSYTNLQMNKMTRSQDFA